MDSFHVGNMDLFVVGDRVLVEPETGEKTTEVGLILPANAVKTPDRGSFRNLEQRDFGAIP